MTEPYSKPIPAISARVIKVTDVTKFKPGGDLRYGSGDPSGVAYLPGSHTLFIADSEHNERPYYSPFNLFAARLDGSFLKAHSLVGFTSEPTGLAFNPVDGLLYITDDDQNAVFWVDPADPSTELGRLDLSKAGIDDPEDLKFDPATGHMFILDGGTGKLVELTTGGRLIGSVVLPAAIEEPEGLAYSPEHEVFFVSSGVVPAIWMLRRDGSVVTTIDVLEGYHRRFLPLDAGLKPAVQALLAGVAPVPKGMELAPSSDPQDNLLSLFVADAGLDNRADGRLFEISLGPSWRVSGSDQGLARLELADYRTPKKGDVSLGLAGGVVLLIGVIAVGWFLLRRKQA